MALSIEEISQIRKVVDQVLAELKLDAYLFEVEPTENQWDIKVECAIHGGGWQTVKLTAKKDYLLRGDGDAVIHQVLLEDWRETLSACKLKPDTSK